MVKYFYFDPVFSERIDSIGVFHSNLKTIERKKRGILHRIRNTGKHGLPYSAIKMGIDLIHRKPINR